LNKTSTLAKKVIVFALILYQGLSTHAFADSCSPLPLTKERIVKIQHILADTMELMGMWIGTIKLSLLPAN
jgi:hypothetical protein